MRRRFLLLTPWLASQSFAQAAGPPAPVAAKTTPAAQAIALYRDEHMPHALPPPCRQGAHGEIVVCGGDGRSQYRLPLPDERGPPEGPRREAGVAAASAAPVTTGSCGTQDQGEHCGGGVSVVGAALFGIQLARALIDPEGASDRADAKAPTPWRH